MLTVDRLIALIALVWVFLYVSSYAVWTWKKKNRIGAVMVGILALAALAMPVVTLFLIEK